MREGGALKWVFRILGQRPSGPREQPRAFLGKSTLEGSPVHGGHAGSCHVCGHVEPGVAGAEGVFRAKAERGGGRSELGAWAFILSRVLSHTMS